uniref:G_PROTEIN_RECEP_F1_2 domain-containing protein n=1 Tax=Haemonchus contortus TaxID=6289 RepID=A0A7I4YQV5_HAECO
MELFRANDSFTRNCGLQMKANVDDIRFVIDGIIGNVIATFSVAFNVLLFYVFSTSKRLRRQNYVNPVLLASFDILTSVCYMLLLPAHVIFFRYSIRILIALWLDYVRIIHCIQHICVTICNFLLVVASVERFFANSPDGRQKEILVFLVKRKVGKMVTIVLTAVALKGTILLETKIEYLPHCRGLERYVPILADQVDGLAGIRYWGRKVSTVIVPFIVLICCNCLIVMELRSKQRESQQKSIKKRSGRIGVTISSIRQHYREKRGVRTATKTLVLVVGCFLLSNLVSIVIGFWGYLPSRVTNSNYYGFLIVSDIASLLTVFGCLMRLPIYCASDARIRKAVGRALFRCRVKTIPIKVHQDQLDKLSMVVVSNSLRSNLTGMNTLFASQERMGGRSKRARDELAFLLQNRRRILVDMAFQLTIDRMQQNCDHCAKDNWLTEIQEEGSADGRESHIRSVIADV